MRVSFRGAAGQVTGSQYLVETAEVSFLVDVGMRQGPDDRGERNREPFGFTPADLDFVLLTHAHLDHCGLLPRAYAEGFRGPVYCTPGTADLVAIVLPDSGQIQEEDARWELRRWQRRGGPGPPPGPLYTAAEAEDSLEHLVPTDYDRDWELPGGVRVRFTEAGHILGSASLRVTCPDGGRERSLVFSGDIGRSDRPILRDPVVPEPAEIVVMESTYGDREHEPWERTLQVFRERVGETLRRGGHVIIPAFAIGRTQDVLWCLERLVRQGEIPEAPIYVDSPMALASTEVMKRHPGYFDEETRDALSTGRSPFRFPGLHYVQTMEQSQKLNDQREPFIVVSASGMCAGGRIRHHLHHHLEHPQDELIIVGYQAEETPGRAILEGREPIYLFGQPHAIRCGVTYLDGFSAHAGQAGLIRWGEQVGAQAEQVFLTHGEEAALSALAEGLEGRVGGRVYIPQAGETLSV